MNDTSNNSSHISGMGNDNNISTTQQHGDSITTTPVTTTTGTFVATTIETTNMNQQQQEQVVVVEGGTTTTTTTTTNPNDIGGSSNNNGSGGGISSSRSSRQTGLPLSDQAVLEYLKSKGMGTAALELVRLLEDKKKNTSNNNKNNDDKKDDHEGDITTSKSNKKMIDSTDVVMKDVEQGGPDEVTSLVAAAAAARQPQTTTEKVDEDGKVTGSKDDEKPTPTTITSLSTPSTTTNASLTLTSIRERFENDERLHRNQRSELVKRTGGSYGYDRETGWPIVSWGTPEISRLSLLQLTTTTTGNEDGTTTIHNNVGANEARAYVNAFVALQLWIMSLPDHDGVQTITHHPIQRAYELLQQHRKNNKNKNTINNNKNNNNKRSRKGGTEDNNTNNDNNNNKKDEENDEDDEALMNAIITEIRRTVLPPLPTSSHGSSRGSTGTGGGTPVTSFNLPPNSKPELFAVSFALLVHIYSELLDYGLENTAHALRDAYRPIYEPLYPTEYLDLDKCTTTEDLTKLTTLNSQYKIEFDYLRKKSIDIAKYQLRRQDLQVVHQTTTFNNNNYHPTSSSITATGATTTRTTTDLQRRQRQHQMMEMEKCDEEIRRLQLEHSALSDRTNQLRYQMFDDLPFLRRVRFDRWQLAMSNNTYALLTSFLNSNTTFTGRTGSSTTTSNASNSKTSATTNITTTATNTYYDDPSSLLSLSTLLQTKCELHVENRYPLPFTPSCVFTDHDDMNEVFGIRCGGLEDGGRNQGILQNVSDLNNIHISWATPSQRILHDSVTNNTTTTTTTTDNKEHQQQHSNTNVQLSFPKFHLAKEYDTEILAKIDKEKVTFNRSLLMNGFRRLEALERKREYDGLSKLQKKRLLSLSSSSSLSGDEIVSVGSSNNMYAANPFEPTILMATLCSDSTSSSLSNSRHTRNMPPPPPQQQQQPNRRRGSNSSLTNSSSSQHQTYHHHQQQHQHQHQQNSHDISTIWEEAGIGMCCAKLCPPDGRRVAVGCDDSAIRIYSALSSNSNNYSTAPIQVLLGHKNGFPVFDVDWNRDGRTLLSAGGDGSIRLWDTMAVGPFGEVTKTLTSHGKTTSNNNQTSSSTTTTTTTTTNKKNTTSTNNTSNPNNTNISNKKDASSSAAALKNQNRPVDNSKKKVRLSVPTSTPPVISSTTMTTPSSNNANVVENGQRSHHDPDMSVPGLRPESTEYVSGAALAVYRGHVPGAPVWSVAMSPVGYYFASVGADGTARLWTTDRPQPVRLFLGHTSPNVNCVTFHPNCNYILTGSDDQTVRLWDIQTGRTVRLLTGCRSGINAVQISPSGKYAVGAEHHHGIVHMWDLGTGKKVTELHTAHPNPTTATTGSGGSSFNNNNNSNLTRMIHCLKFSSCGSSLATGGDDCTIRIWDVRTETIENIPWTATPLRAYPTRQAVLMDFHYTRKNLLIAVGKYVTPITYS